MTLTIENPEVQAQLLAKARAEGLSPGAYVESLFRKDEERERLLAEFRDEIEARIAGLDRGEATDGEQAMQRLIHEPSAGDSASVR